MKGKARLALLFIIALTLFYCLPTIEVNQVPIINPSNYVVMASTTTTAPYLRLYTERSSGSKYLMIQTYAYGTGNYISSVKVNGSEDDVVQRENDLYRYKIKESKDYKVVVRDSKGETSSEKEYITKDDEPVIKLSKKITNGKTYLVIDVETDVPITKMTVNGDSESIDEYGGTVKYRVTSSDTYKVVVKCNNGNSASEDLYVSVGDDNDILIRIDSKCEDGICYLVIDVDSDKKVKKIKVNGDSIGFDFTYQGTAYYKITTSDTYEVVVTDSNNHSEDAERYVDINVLKKYNVVTKNNTTVKNNGSSSAYTNNVVTPVINPWQTTINNTTTKNQTVLFTLNSNRWSMNAIPQAAMDSSMTSKNGRVYLSIRYLSYALGIDSSNIFWNNATQTVTILDGGHNVTVTLNSKYMYVDGMMVQMDAAPINQNSRVMLPVSQIAKAFGYKNIQLNWNNATKQLTVKY